jgi:DNA polymerase III subunit delta
MLIFLYGADTFRSRKKLKEIKDNYRYKADPSGLSLVHLDASEKPLVEISEVVSPAGLFNKKRLVVLDGLFKNKDLKIFSSLCELLDRHKSAEEGNVIVLIDAISKKDKLPKEKKALFDILLQEKFAQNFELFSAKELASWARLEFKSRGGAVNEDALSLLIELSENDIWRLDGEIEKILNYKWSVHKTEGAMPLVTREDVLGADIFAGESGVFRAVDGVSGGGKEDAVKALEDFFASGEKDSALLPLLTRQFKIIMEVKEFLAQGFTTFKISKELGLPSFVVQKAAVQSRKYSSGQIKTIYNSLARFDFESKTGERSLPALLGMLFART